MAQLSSWRHLINQFKELDKHHHLLTTDEIYQLYSIGKQLQPEYDAIRQTLHNIRSRIDPDYVQDNRAKGLVNKSFKKSVSDMQLPVADVQILRSGSAKEQLLEAQVLELTKQAAYHKSVSLQQREQIAQLKDQMHWLNVELSGLQQTTAIKQKAMQCK